MNNELTSISAPGMEQFLNGGIRLLTNSKNLQPPFFNHATCIGMILKLIKVTFSFGFLMDQKLNP